MKIAILGGGLAGLTAGLFLKEKGYDFDLLESDSKAGGLCQTVIKDGFVFDVGGGHIIFSKDKETLQFMLSLFRKDEIVGTVRDAKIYYKGSYVKYPFENGLADLPKTVNYRCLKEYVEALLKRKTEGSEPKNFREWLIYRFGKGISQEYLIPYNEKIWNFGLEDMNFDWIKDRVPDPPLGDIIKSSLGMPTEGYKHQSVFYYPLNGGIQALTDRIAGKIKNKIKLNNPVESVEKRGNKWLVNGIKYDRVISTIPLQELSRVLAGISPKIEKAVDNLVYNSLAAFLVGLDESSIGGYSWLYFPDKSVPYNRVVYQSNYSPGNTPRGKSSLIVEITYLKGKDLNVDDRFIKKNIIDNLARQNIIDKDKVCLVDWRKTEYAYVIYDLNYNKNIGLIYDYLNEIGIQFQGRFSRFRYINMDQVIREVREFVEKDY